MGESNTDSSKKLCIGRSLPVVFSLLLLASVTWLAFIAMRGTWRALAAVNVTLAISVISAVTTVITATVTVMFGRYFERKREIEAHFRGEKIKMYDSFLAELFKTLLAGDSQPKPDEASDTLVKFLREWQRKLILWGGSNVLRAYFQWMNHLKRGNPDAKTMFLMDEFFRALRSDIGQNSRGLPRGAFVNVILRHGDLFLREAAKNPSITFAEIARLEKEQYG